MGDDFEILVPDDGSEPRVLPGEMGEQGPIEDFTLQNNELRDRLRRVPGWALQPDRFTDQDQVDSALATMAIWGTSNNGPGEPMYSKDVPDTGKGNLACAWAVNRIATLALGRAIGGGLSTSDMCNVLTGKHRSTPNEAFAGRIIISPTVFVGKKRHTGHVGIIGSGELVYSNSSSAGRWEQNYTVKKWLDRFSDKPNGVRLFALDPGLFS